MSDDRVTVATAKQINLAQLDVELGGYGLNGADGLVQVVEGSPVTEAQLAAGVAAHVAVFPERDLGRLRWFMPGRWGLLMR